MTSAGLTGSTTTRPTWLRMEATIAWRMLLIAAATLLVIWLTLQVTVIAIVAFLVFTQAALLTFVLAFVPMIGATIAGAAAVAVARFLGGFSTAV